MANWTADVIEWAFTVWPAYPGAIVLASLVICVLLAPLTVLETRWVVRRLASRYRVRSTDPYMDRIWMYRAVFSGSTLVIILVRRAVLLCAAIVVLVTMLGLVQMDSDNGGGPHYVDQGTELWLALRDSGGQMPFGKTDLGQSAYAAYDAAGLLTATRHMVIPLAFVAVYAVTITRRGLWSNRTVRVLTALAIGLLTPGAFVLYLITALAVNTAAAALVGRTRAGGAFVGRAA